MLRYKHDGGKRSSQLRSPFFPLTSLRALCSGRLKDSRPKTFRVSHLLRLKGLFLCSISLTPRSFKDIMLEMRIRADTGQDKAACKVFNEGAPPELRKAPLSTPGAQRGELEPHCQIERNAGVGSPNLVLSGQYPGIQSPFWEGDSTSSQFRKRRPQEDAGLGAAALRRAGRDQARGSEVLTGSTAPSSLGPAAPHGGSRPLGRRPGLPHRGGLDSPPQSVALEPGSGPHLVPGHGCASSGLGTDGKSDGSAPGPGGSAAPTDTSPTTALGSCISERERHPALSSQALEIRLRRGCQGAGARRSRPGALRLARVTRRRRSAAAGKPGLVVRLKEAGT